MPNSTPTPQAAPARDEIAEQLAAEAGPGMADLYEVDAATRRLFTQRADRVRQFIAAELVHLADTGYWCDDMDVAQSVARVLRARADELDPPT